MRPSLLALVARARRSGTNEISRGHRGTVGEWVQESLHPIATGRSGRALAGSMDLLSPIAVSNILGIPPVGSRMTKRKIRVVHCYRCIYTWRARYRVPRICPRCKSKYWSVPKILPVRIGSGLGIEEILGPYRSRLLLLARRYGAHNVRVFGSVRRGAAGRNSDVDLLVIWPNHPSLLRTAEFRIAVRELVGRDVDVVDESQLHWAIQPQILAEAVPL